ncbi:ABC transporter ATP-binding protein [Catalinimonas niigatensis]|uniref:ABC transporter ATP-binding protein n=1 Tax=Catalinimonas niigatensis TaxID=1397264 RepID=UPI002AA2A5EA|nr:ATP-binding cassette domain-containing protein [Catalinimonas niigatensis]WPP49927.1 ATP-binding cassette domain-containing protein [Catalinimonas niigatensis]
MIEVSELSKDFNGKLAVDRVSFQIEEGQTMVLLGTSGCGKTTTMKMINRLIEPSSGQVFVGGKDVQKQVPEELRKNIGYVIQSIGLFPHYTVAQNIGLVPSLLRWSESKIKDRSEELMALIGLPLSLLNRLPHELSGGQQQRVGLARALAADPQLILMDEPFGALDPITKQQIQREFLTLETLRKKTMIIVTHDVFEAVTLGDHVCLMDRGRIQQQGTPYELIFRPANEFVHSFFNSQRFRLELQVVKLKDIAKLLKTSAPEEIPHPVQNISLPPNTSLLEALEELEKEDMEWLSISEVEYEKRPSKLLNREKLLHYFYQLKKELSQS